FGHSFTDISRAGYHVDTTFTHDFHFCRSSIICTANDSTGVAHTATRRRGLTSDETYYWFSHIIFQPLSCFRFHITANLTNHDDTVSFRVVHQHFYSFFGSSTNDRVTTNTNCGRNTKTCFYHLVCSFIS